MRVKQIARLMVAAIGATFVVVPSLSPGVAHADSAVGLGIETYAQMVVDSARSQLFFSPGRGGSGVRVTNLSGGSQATIPDLPDASGMALSPDGSTLHVALIEAGAIAAIDTTTRTEIRRYNIGASTCPTWLAPAGGKLYFGYGCTFGKGKLGSLDVRGETPVLALDLPLGDVFAYPPLLRSSPAKPNLLLAVNQSGIANSYSSRATLFDVSSGTPSITAALPWDTCGGLGDAALTVDASTAILACGLLENRSVIATHHVAFSTTDFSPAGVFPSASYPNAVTTSPNGALVVVGSSNGSDWERTSSIHVERPDGTLLQRYDFPQDTYLVRQGLAVSADSRTLYAVTREPGGQYLTLRLMTDLLLPRSSLTLSAPPTVGRGGKVLVTGSLAFTDAPVSAPWQLQVVRQDQNGTHVLPNVSTTETGAFFVSDIPRATGANTYTVTFPGDAAHLGSSRSVTVQVVARPRL